MSKTPRILVIQGEEDVASPLRDALRSGPYEVEVAMSAAGAVRRLLHRACDVVMTSPSSAVGEDIALVRYLQRIQPGLRTIVLAPTATPGDVIAALRSHVFACFQQPFHPAEILRMLDRALAEPDWRDGISVVSASSEWLCLRIVPRRVTAERLISFMDALISDQGGDRRDLITAYRELLQNAIEHGAGFDPEKVVEVSAIRTAKAIVFHFRDPGPGFSAEDLPHAAVSNPPDDPTAHVEERVKRGMRPGGFGILMAKSLADEVLYNEAGNEVILIKHLA